MANDQIYAIIVIIRSAYTKKMRYENVSPEFAWLCIEMSANISVKADANILRKADICQDFVFFSGPSEG